MKKRYKDHEYRSAERLAKRFLASEPKETLLLTKSLNEFLDTLSSSEIISLGISNRVFDLTITKLREQLQDQSPMC